MFADRHHAAVLTGSSLLTAAFLLFVPMLLTAQNSAPSDEAAEHMPLAAKSLLLDVIDAGDAGLVAVGERGHVVLSADGETWVQADSVPTRSTLTTVTHHEGQLWTAGHDSVILTSKDGGMNWALQYFDADRQQPIMDIHFFDASNGMAIGAYGLMLSTADGGATWEDAYVSDEEWHLNALLDLGAGLLFIAGEAGLSYRSTDQGVNWEIIEMPYQGSMFGISSGGDCMLVFGLRGHAQESCDGGLNWIELETGIEASLSGGISVAGTTLLAGNSGAVLTRAADGSFTENYHSSGVDFASVIALGEGRYLLVGEEGVHHWPESTAGDGT